MTDVVTWVKPAFDRVQRVLTRPMIMDILLVLVLITVVRVHGQVDPRSESGRWVWAFDVALLVPLFWRRRQPTVVFLVVAAVALVQWLTGSLAQGDLAILLALYAVGAYERDRWRIALAAAIAELGVVLAVDRWAPPGEHLTSGLFVTGTATAAIVLGVYRRTRRHYLQSLLERAATAEHERDQQAVIAVASERARISREMHDIVAHSLSVMIALSDGAAISVPRDPAAAQQAMEQSSALGRQALGEVRRLLGGHHLVDELTPQPGIAQLDDLVTQVRSAGLAVDLVVDGQPLALPPGAQLAVYRTVQEALTNVLKHAPAATRAVVRVRYLATGVDIEVQNDDEPVKVLHRVDSAGALPEPGPVGHGLAGMRERAAVFGGSVEAARQADGGWRVTSHLTVQEDPGL